MRELCDGFGVGFGVGFRSSTQPTLMRKFAPMGPAPLKQLWRGKPHPTERPIRLVMNLRSALLVLHSAHVFPLLVPDIIEARARKSENYLG